MNSPNRPDELKYEMRTDGVNLIHTEAAFHDAYSTWRWGHANHAAKVPTPQSAPAFYPCLVKFCSDRKTDWYHVAHVLHWTVCKEGVEPDPSKSSLADTYW